LVVWLDVGDPVMKNLLQMIKGAMAVLGRTLLCAACLAAALGYTAPGVKDLLQNAASKGTPPSQWVFIVAIVLLAVGVVSVVLGYRARIGASLLLAFLVLATWPLQGLTFWSLVNAQARHEQLVCLVMNVSLIGAMLFILANGAGQMSLDAKRR
jgi:putative oxidoreductase